MDAEKDITVIIGTSDGYSNLWRNFDILFRRYWKLNTKNVFVSQNKNVPLIGYDTITAGDIPWGGRLLKALELIKTKYVFFILEDYYLTEEITKEHIQLHLDLLLKHQSKKIMISEYCSYYTLHNIEGNLYQFDRNSEYLNSVQPAIWDVEYFKSVLDKNYTPWDFEIRGNCKASEINEKLLILQRETPIFFNLSRISGYRTQGWEKLFKKEGLYE